MREGLRLHYQHQGGRSLWRHSGVSLAIGPDARSRPGARVGIDCRNLRLPHGTGIAVYGRTLLQVIGSGGFHPTLLSSGDDRPGVARWLAAASGRVSRAVRDESGWLATDVFRVAQVHFDLWGDLRRVRGDPPALMHWTSPLPLTFEGCPNVVTVHDLIPVLHPGLSGTDGVRLRRMLTRIVAKADHVITVSEATRQEVIQHLGGDPSRVTNTWQAVMVEGPAAALPGGLSPEGYWLHVGVVERRKNLVRLIQAWRQGGGSLPLVLAGPDGWQASEVLAEAAGDPRIIRLPWLDRATLLAVIAGARALLMPSLAEGFGLPLAEAMALGTPALVAAGGAMEEVAGGAALLMDALDVRSIAAGMAALDVDDALRQRLAAAGRERARLFALDAYAARIMAVYETVLGS